MLDLQQLHQLVTIAERGTLSAAAEVFHISQPALTRSMQRLEDSFGVKLFDRRKNRVELNEAGHLVVERARIVLESARDMERRMADYARSQNTISLGSCAPGPMWLLSPQLSGLYPDRIITSEMKEQEVLLEGLRDGVYQLIITEGQMDQDGILCKPYFREQLSVSLPPAHPLAQKKSVSFADLEGQTMLLFSELGVWQRLHDEKMKGIHFIVQTERQAFADLVTASVLPSFTTNLTSGPASADDPPLNRMTVPLSDPEATKYFYLCALKTNRGLFDSVAGRIER